MCQFARRFTQEPLTQNQEIDKISFMLIAISASQNLFEQVVKKVYEENLNRN